jgi:aryl-alcohol dehydrogenase-like predicted oxidoreductase
VQPQYSLIVRDIEREVLPAATNFDLAVVPWSPLARGFLTGKYRRGEPPPADTRLGRTLSWLDIWQRWDAERNWQIVDTVGKIAQARDTTRAQVALNWLLHRPGVTAPIIGVTSMAQLEDSLATLEWGLSPEEIIQLDESSAFDIGYPYEFIQNIHKER